MMCRRLEEMKHKHKKVKVSENLDFPGREEIKFGEVVKAPPKLVTIPKVALNFVYSPDCLFLVIQKKPIYLEELFTLYSPTGVMVDTTRADTANLLSC